jgi:hypothetical protein
MLNDINCSSSYNNIPFRQHSPALSNGQRPASKVGVPHAARHPHPLPSQSDLHSSRGMGDAKDQGDNGSSPSRALLVGRPRPVGLLLTLDLDRDTI